jgi:hypothetical protein
MDRRTFIKGVVIAASTPAAACAPPRPLTLDALFADYETVIALDNQAWTIVRELEDSATMASRPEKRIQVGRRIVGIDAEGNDRFEPIYAWSIAQIEKSARSARDHQMVFARTEDHKNRVAERYVEQVAERSAAFNAIEAERRLIEDACGHTAALDTATSASARVRAVEQAILEFVPTTLEEASRKARWIVAELQGDRAHLLDREDVAEVALASIARAFG